MSLNKKINFLLELAVFLMVVASPGWAHFGMVIPSDNMVMPTDHRSIRLTLSFSHPFEGVGMGLVEPKAFGVMANGKNQSLLESLKPIRVMEQPAWFADYRIRRPGVYVFYMEPEPYWEPAEDVFIVHLTKTVVAAFGDDAGWSEEIGLKTEIVPLSKPYGLYAGNVFQGIVKMNGKPVPFAEVEVEYYNPEKTARAPTDYMITQTLQADPNGVFTYATPRSGWWGFAALNQADYVLKTASGEEKGVEIGAVLWVHFEKWIEK
jgi:cobalt/nickel transport protein